jgi:hypothetical protein
MSRGFSSPALLAVIVMLGVGGCQGEAFEPSAICQRHYEAAVHNVQERGPNYSGIVVHIDSIKQYYPGDRHRRILVRGGPVEGGPFHGTPMFAAPSDCVPVFWRTGEDARLSELRLNMRVSLWVHGVAETEPGHAEIYGLRIDFPPSPSHIRR